MAALNFAMQFLFFMFVLFSAFGQACCQEVSREIGAERYKNIKRFAKYGLLTTLIFITPLCVVVAINPEVLMVIIGNSSDSIQSIVRVLVPIIATTVLFDAVRYNVLQMLRALHDHVYSTAISVLSMWLGILLASILGFWTTMGIYGIAVGYLIGILFGSISLIVRLFKVKLRRQEYIELAALSLS